MLKYVSWWYPDVKAHPLQTKRLCKILPEQEECLHLRSDLPLVDQVEDGSAVTVQSV